MPLTAQSQAILLLTANLGKADATAGKPLSNGEWGRFASWLHHKGRSPADLLAADSGQVLADMADRTVSADRVRTLLDRGAALALALEKWERAGLWVLTRADQAYPDRLKRRLRESSPPVLFGCGNLALLDRGGVAIVGSRDASEDDLTFTRDLGRQAATWGVSVVSGGAKGTDEAAMAGTLDGEGTGVAILADSLLRSATSSRYRRALMSGDLVLVSPFNPEAGFFAGNAMARNRYIYCLSDAAVVVCSTPNKGGTWNGAVEALKGRWVPVWVKPAPGTASGNMELVKLGADLLPTGPLSFQALLAGSTRQAAPSLPAAELAMDSPAGTQQELEAPPVPAAAGKAEECSLDDFLARLAAISSLAAMKPDEIARHLGMESAMTRALLKRGVAEHRLEKTAKPIRYRLAIPQPTLF